MGNECPCLEKPAENHNQSDHKSRRSNSNEKSKKPKVSERLKAEFAMLRNLVKMNQENKFNKTFEVVREYYYDK